MNRDSAMVTTSEHARAVVRRSTISFRELRVLCRRSVFKKAKYILIFSSMLAAGPAAWAQNPATPSVKQTGGMAGAPAVVMSATDTGVTSTSAQPQKSPSGKPFDPGILKDLDQPAKNRLPAAPAKSVSISGNEVQCAALIYGGNQKSKCFANQFLADLSQNTNVRTQPQFIQVRMDAKELFCSPFAVLSGEGAFKLTDAERANLKQYLENGGFLLASAGCSSKPWADSFTAEMKRLMPSRTMVKLPPENAIFHTVYDVRESHYKSGKDRFPDLFGVEIDGRVAVIFSPDGLNDTGNAGKDCCCCGGDEVKAAKQINVNVLAYALTH